jgi:NADP-dependent 3-hydroxy acid dehydrogenase YdfG
MSRAWPRSLPPVQIDGSRVLLTGASGGLGSAIARALHERGAHLLVTARRADVLQQLASDLGGDRVDILPADLAQRSDVDALPGRAGQVDVLVHNAGLPGTGKLESFTPEELDRVIDVNLRAGVQLARALVPPMVERGRGHVVFVSSISGKVPTGGASIYSATKFGLRGFAGALRDDLHKSGVGVSGIFPGVIEDAGLWADAGMQTPKGVPKRYPKDVADAVVTAIAKDVGEIDVADPLQRAGALMAGVAPTLAARVRRLVGIDRFAADLAERQKEKR